jgi:methylated-DNA-[protein]-cysteine S-methyltransferase
MLARGLAWTNRSDPLPIESYRRFKTPLGTMEVTADRSGLRELRFVNPSRPRISEAHCRPGGKLVDRAAAELAEYFAGLRQRFDLRVAPVGSSFDQELWRALSEVPFGATVTYGELAARIGRPRAARAVGAGMHRNPIAIVIPCHRVIGNHDRLVGYAAGLERKRWLLALERGKVSVFAQRTA